MATAAFHLLRLELGFSHFTTSLSRKVFQNVSRCNHFTVIIMFNHLNYYSDILILLTFDVLPSVSRVYHHARPYRGSHFTENKIITACKTSLAPYTYLISCPTSFPVCGGSATPASLQFFSYATASTLGPLLLLFFLKCSFPT